MTIRDKIRRLLDGLAHQWPAPEPSLEEAPDPYATLVRDYLDEAKLGEMLHLELVKAIHTEIERAAQHTVEHHLYRTPEGKALLEAARDAVKNYPVVDWQLEEKLRQAVAKAIMESLQTERKLR